VLEKVETFGGSAPPFDCCFTFGTALGIELMDHSQAVEQMAAERYLLDELPPEAREAFEEHVFDCSECAVDLRAASAFVDEAKVQLPAWTKPLPDAPTTSAARSGRRRDYWLSWLRPAFAVPAFAALLAVVGYQNLVTLPAMRSESNQPRLLPWTPLHGATRGGARETITADHAHGIAFPVDLSPLPGSPAYTSYSFDISDAEGKLFWTGSIAAPPASESTQGILLAIPAATLRNGAYTVAVFGVEPHGQRIPIDRYTFVLVFND